MTRISNLANKKEINEKILFKYRLNSLRKRFQKLYTFAQRPCHKKGAGCLRFPNFFVTLRPKVAKLLRLGKKKNKFFCFALDFS